MRVRRLCLRLCLRWRWSVSLWSAYSLPDPDLLTQQADWLASARSALLRRVSVARRCQILDLGAGYGAVSQELARRGGGRVVVLDVAWHALRNPVTSGAPLGRVCGYGQALPFPARSFDLVFSQLTLLWIQPAEAALDEISRILQPGGALVALEPDYGGMIEHPPGIVTRDLWLAGIARAGADPYIGRRLPDLLSQRGFDVQISLFDTLYAPDPARFDFLRDLPLAPEEVERLSAVEFEAAGLNRPWSQLAHLPFFLISAIKQR